MNVKLSTGKVIPMEMHKVRIVQKTRLLPIAQRLRAIQEAGYNTFQLRLNDIFLDMLTDSGTNAMSDNQLAAMMVSDDAYAGSESFYKLEEAVKEVLGFEYTIPVHQGRAAEHLLAKALIKPGDMILMNHHYSTTSQNFTLVGGHFLNCPTDEVYNTQSADPFKGNMDLGKFKAAIKEYGADRIPLVRMEASTNYVGGQPFSLRNLRETKEIAAAHDIPLVFDGSLIADNAYFIQQREEGYADKSIGEIIQEMMSLVDILYLSARKSTSVRGGLIATNSKQYYDRILPWLVTYEGYATYGGMSTKEIEAMAVGLREMTDVNVAGSAPEFIQYFAQRLVESGIPAVTPPGAVGCHVDAKLFLPHVPPSQYPAGALPVALYIASGVRSLGGGTMGGGWGRDADGTEIPAPLELVRLAIPRRVYTLSHIEYTVDRLTWIYKHRDLVKGLRFVEQPEIYRFYFGKLEPLDNWDAELVQAFEADFGPDC